MKPSPYADRLEGLFAMPVGAFMPLLNPLLRGNYEPYRGISARTVGQAMLGAMRSGRRGVQHYTHDGIEALARLGPRNRVPPAPKPAGRQR